MNKKRKAHFQSEEKLKVFIGKSIFNFENDDVYAGEFKVVFPDTIYKEGYGMYASNNDNTLYVGNWVYDEMIYGKVKFKNGVTYIGNVKESKYHGKGNYRVPGVGDILANFYNNRPTGEVVLVDVNGFYWYGQATSRSVTLYPANPFISNPLWGKDASSITLTNQDPAHEITFPEEFKNDYKINYMLLNVDLKQLVAMHSKKYGNTFFSK